MNVKKLVTLLLAAVLVLSLAACGAAGGDKKDGEPKNAEEAAAMYKELMEQDNVKTASRGYKAAHHSGGSSADDYCVRT